jgi:imidazolonepropionase-like amidohydrolase
VAAQGYDFIKLTLDISRPVYDAIVDEAPRNGMRVAGHVDPQVGLERAIEAGQQIEHLDGYFEAILADSAPSRVSVSNFSVFRLANWSSLDHLDDAKLARIAGETARRGIWTSPTLTVFNTAFAIGQQEDEIRARPDWQFQPAKQRELYLGANRRYWAPTTAAMRTEARRKRFVAVRNGLVKAIADSGGKILAGSDTPEWFHVYGFALHRELASLVTAGLTPYQALEAATRNPAEFFAASADWGTIEAGKRADLVLLSANPLSDIANTARIDAVAVGGRWLSRQELDRMNRAAAERLGGKAP